MLSDEINTVRIWASDCQSSICVQLTGRIQRRDMTSTNVAVMREVWRATLVVALMNDFIIGSTYDYVGIGLVGSG